MKSENILHYKPTSDIDRTTVYCTALQAHDSCTQRWSSTRCTPGGRFAPCGSCAVGRLAPTEDGSPTCRRPEAGAPPLLLSPLLVCVVLLLFVVVTVTGAVVLGPGFRETVPEAVPPVGTRKRNWRREGTYAESKGHPCKSEVGLR